MTGIILHHMAVNVPQRLSHGGREVQHKMSKHETLLQKLETNFMSYKTNTQAKHFHREQNRLQTTESDGKGTLMRLMFVLLERL